MKKKLFIQIMMGGFIFAVGLVGGIIVGIKRGVPFVTEGEQWTIGIYSGDSPFSVKDSFWRFNPVLKAEDVTDVNAKFVADPFLIHEDDEWYLFFEVFDNATQQGDLAVATSKNTRSWKYQRVILDEPFHLSYPYVFKWQDDFYLIPETFEANSIRLYKATNFPYDWEFVETLVSGRDYVDNSIVYYQDRWWLFSSVTSNDTLYLHYADDLLGPWQEHPASPIITNNLHISRSSGRMLVYQDHLYRFTMDVDPPNGTHQVWAYEVTKLTPTEYAEELHVETPIIMATGKGWNGQAMHQLDANPLGEDRWIASVDGFGKYLIFGIQY